MVCRIQVFGDTGKALRARARGVATILDNCFKRKEKHDIPAERSERGSGFAYWLPPNGDFHYMGDLYLHYDIRHCLKKNEYKKEDDTVPAMPRKFQRLTGAVKTDAFMNRVEYEVSLDKPPTAKQERAMREVCEVRGDCRLTVWKPKEKYCVSREITPREMPGTIERCRI